MSVDDVARSYIEAISKNNYEEAANFIVSDDINNMYTSFKKLRKINDPLILEFIGLGDYGQNELKQLTPPEVFSAIAKNSMRAQNENWGNIENLKLIGVVREQDNLAHAIVRDKINNSHSSVIMLVKDKSEWKVKMPVIMDGLIELHLKYTEK